MIVFLWDGYIHGRVVAVEKNSYDAIICSFSVEDLQCRLLKFWHVDDRGRKELPCRWRFLAFSP